MELEKDTMYKLVEYLKKHDYPDESLAIEYRIPNTNYRADLAVVDPKTNIPIIIFELKSRKSKELISRGQEQLKKYLSSLPNNQIPAYLVFPKSEAPFFEIINIHKEGEEIENNYNIIQNLDYRLFRNTALSQNANTVQEKKKKVFNSLGVVSWILAGLLLILLVFKKIYNFNLDGTDTVLIGGIVGLVLIPFASKAKFLGIEFERYTDAKKEKNSDE